MPASQQRTHVHANTGARVLSWLSFAAVHSLFCLREYLNGSHRENPANHANHANHAKHTPARDEQREQRIMLCW